MEWQSQPSPPKNRFMRIIDIFKWPQLGSIPWCVDRFHSEPIFRQNNGCSLGGTYNITNTKVRTVEAIQCALTSDSFFMVSRCSTWRLEVPLLMPHSFHLLSQPCCAYEAISVHSSAIGFISVHATKFYR